MWTLGYQSQRIAEGKTLRIITDRPATIHWRFDGWATANDTEAGDVGFGCWFADLPSHDLNADARVVFTFLWESGAEGKDFSVTIGESKRDAG